MELDAPGMPRAPHGMIHIGHRMTASLKCIIFCFVCYCPPEKTKRAWKTEKALFQRVLQVVFVLVYGVKSRGSGHVACCVGIVVEMYQPDGLLLLYFFICSTSRSCCGGCCGVFFCMTGAKDAVASGAGGSAPAGPTSAVLLHHGEGEAVV